MLINNKKNAFIECADKEDYKVFKDVLDECKCDSTAITNAESRCKVPFEFPVVIRISNGIVQDIIIKNDLQGLDIKYAVKGFTIGTLVSRHSWRMCGCFSKHYDWTAKDWIASWGLNSSNPYLHCFNCGKKFDDDEILYQGFFKVDENGNSQLKSICKKCAYELSDLVTDYEYLGNDEIEVVEWKRETQEQQELLEDNKNNPAVSHTTACIASDKHLNSIKVAHSVGVAEYMRENASKYYLNGDCMYIVGLLHDIGYMIQKKNHPILGATMIADLLSNNGDSKELEAEVLNHKFLFAIQNHGKDPYELLKEHRDLPAELLLLYEADMSVNKTGHRVGFVKRLEDVGSRYGFESPQYKVAVNIVKWIKEEAINKYNINLDTDENN